MIRNESEGGLRMIKIRTFIKALKITWLCRLLINPKIFYTNIQQHAFEIGNENVIFCGDWNLILNPILDSENYRNINNPRARDAIIKIIEQNGYIYIWRVENENKKKITWRRLNPDKKQSRLDFFLVSEDAVQFVQESGIVPGYRTDHSGVYIKVKLQDNERGKGYWKFNNSLLKDKDYIQSVKNTIQDTLKLYTINNNNNNSNNNNNNNNLQFTINEQLFLEVLLMMIKYSSRKKKKKKKKKKTEKEETYQNIRG